MVLNSRTKEFILITLDEYSSLNATKHSDQHKCLESDSSIFPTGTKQTCPEQFTTQVSSETRESFPSASECAQLNLKERFRKKKESKESDVKRGEIATAAVRSDNVILDLLSCGLSGGKVERARQILRKITNSGNVSVDNNSGRIFLHDRDTGVTVIDFLSDVQTPTKKLTEDILDLVQRLRLPEYLLANTHAKKVAANLKRIADNGEEDPSSISSESNQQAKWLRLY